MQPHTITDPPPNFTVPSTSLSLSPCPALFQAHLLPSDPRQFILVSYYHTTLFQSSRVQSLCLVAKSILSLSYAPVIDAAFTSSPLPSFQFFQGVFTLSVRKIFVKAIYYDI